MPVTRFYLPSTGAAAVEPTPNAGWENISIHAHLKCVTTKIASAMTSVNLYQDPWADGDYLFRQYVSDPIAAQTILAQTVKIQMRATQGFNVQVPKLRWAIYVFSNDGSTLRGTLVAMRTDDIVFNSTGTLVNRGDSVTSTEVVTENGDRIVIEIGAYHNYYAYSSTLTLSIGDNSGTDLPENDTEYNAYNPWLEFTNEITFLGPVTLVISDMAQSQSLEALALTQVHNLTIADLLHSQALDGLTLTQLHNLIVNDMLHSQTLDELVLIELYLLVIHDLLHSQALEGINLSQLHNLIIAELLHIQNLEGMLWVHEPKLEGISCPIPGSLEGIVCTGTVKPLSGSEFIPGGSLK